MNRGKTLFGAGQDVDFEFGVGAFNLCQRFLNRRGTCQQDAIPSVSFYFRFAEEADMDILLRKDLLEMGEDDLVRVSLYDNGLRSARSEKADRRDRETQDGTHMKSEFAQILRYHCNHTGIVRTG